MVFYRDDLAIRRIKNFESEKLESMCFELSLNKRKWCILVAYKPPCFKNDDFSYTISNCLDHIITKYDNYLVIGDLNFDMNKESKSSTLQDIIDIYNLENVVKDSTCFTKNHAPSLIDVILTNNPQLICNTSNLTLV